MNRALPLRIGIARHGQYTVARPLVPLYARHGMLPNLSATVATGSTSQVRFADGVGEDDVDDVPSDALTDLFAEPLPFMRVSGVLTVPLGNRAARTEREVANFNVQIRRAERVSLNRTILWSKSHYKIQFVRMPGEQLVFLFAKA